MTRMSSGAARLSEVSSGLGAGAAGGVLGREVGADGDAGAWTSEASRGAAFRSQATRSGNTNATARGIRQETAAQDMGNARSLAILSEVR